MFPKQWHKEALEMREAGYRSRAIGAALGLSKSAINYFFVAYDAEQAFELDEPPMHADEPTDFQGAKILFIDLETAPTLAYSYPRFKAFISPEAIIQEPFILTFSAQWYHDQGNVINGRAKHGDDYLIMQEIWHLLDAADIVVAHNLNKFDKGWMNQRFCFHDMTPPSPYKCMDTLVTLKKAFALPSNSLAAACNFFNLPRKTDSGGIATAIAAAHDNCPKAFDHMQEYNDNDVEIMIALFDKVKRFAPNLPNMALFGDDETLCPHCGSGNVMPSTKTMHTSVSEYPMLECMDCGRYSRPRKSTRRAKLVQVK